MLISVIIPTLNEEHNLGRLLDRLLAAGAWHNVEVLVADGGSTDHTMQIARDRGIRVLRSARPGRAIQMNLAAEHAAGEVLYFVHGDTLPPNSFASDIHRAIGEDFDLGCYRFRFESNRRLLKINSFFTRFDRAWCRGGDQSLFIKKKVFQDLEGYREHFVIMEDFDLLRRARKKYHFKLMTQEILVSPRKYEDNHYLQVQFANLVVFNMFRFGMAPQLIFGDLS